MHCGTEWLKSFTVFYAYINAPESVNILQDLLQSIMTYRLPASRNISNENHLQAELDNIRRTQGCALQSSRKPATGRQRRQALHWAEQLVLDLIQEEISAYCEQS
jgi:hypothetical protein